MTQSWPPPPEGSPPERRPEQPSGNLPQTPVASPAQVSGWGPVTTPAPASSPAPHPPSAGSSSAAPNSADASEAAWATSDTDSADAMLHRLADADPALRLQAFLAEEDPARALAIWSAGFLPARGSAKDHLDQAMRLVSSGLTDIDRRITKLLNAVLHHDRFQALHAAWLGVQKLTDSAARESGVVVRALDASWAELSKEASRAASFDRTPVFQKVYEDEFGMPGGRPYGVLIGDYAVRHLPSKEHPYDDLETLEMIGHAAAAAFVPFVASAHPSLLGLNAYEQLEHPSSLSAIFESQDYLRWRSFRKQPDARFIGLALPRVLMREPYKHTSVQSPVPGHPLASSANGFRFTETTTAPDGSEHLWGNAAFAFASVLIRSHGTSRWLADIRGFTRETDAGGLVTNFQPADFATDAPGDALKPITEIVIDESREKQLSAEGLIPLCACRGTPYGVFYSTPSLHHPPVFDDTDATLNARISSMLQYTFCVSRFAHYLKVIARDKTGSYGSAVSFEDHLTRWLADFVAGDENAAPEIKARYPLRQAEVRVTERLDSPGHYDCSVKLWPHYQLDELVASVELTTQINPRK